MTSPTRVDTLTDWAVSEAAFSAAGYDGIAAPDALAERAGLLPVLLSAPHAVNHVRNGTTKFADMGTGGLAAALAQRTDAHLLVSAGRPVLDPNFDAGGPFKAALAARLTTGSDGCRATAVVDLHGMRDAHGVDVCLGRGAVPERSAPLLAVLGPALETAGFSVAVDAPFDAANPNTVTSAAQALGVPAVQMELSRSLRVNADSRSVRLFDVLAATLPLLSSARVPGPRRPHD